MQTGLQYIPAQGAFYYFDEDGYQKTGKIANVEDDDDSYTFYFNTKNGKNGQGVTGEKDGYLYFNGQRLEADDDYRIYTVGGEYYLVNTKGKIQKSESKEYDVELASGKTIEEVKFNFKNSDAISSVVNNAIDLAAEASYGKIVLDGIVYTNEPVEDTETEE